MVQNFSQLAILEGNDNCIPVCLNGIVVDVPRHYFNTNLYNVKDVLDHSDQNFLNKIADNFEKEGLMIGDDGFVYASLDPDDKTLSGDYYEVIGILDGEDLELGGFKFKVPKFKAPKFKVPKFKAPKFKVPKFKAPKFKVDTKGISKGISGIGKGISKGISKIGEAAGMFAEGLMNQGQPQEEPQEELLDGDELGFDLSMLSSVASTAKTGGNSGLMNMASTGLDMYMPGAGSLAKTGMGIIANNSAAKKAKKAKQNQDRIQLLQNVIKNNPTKKVAIKKAPTKKVAIKKAPTKKVQNKNNYPMVSPKLFSSQAPILKSSQEEPHQTSKKDNTLMIGVGIAALAAIGFTMSGKGKK